MDRLKQKNAIIRRVIVKRVASLVKVAYVRRRERRRKSLLSFVEKVRREPRCLVKRNS